MTRNSTRKKRTEGIYATTRNEVTELSLHIDPDTSEVRFGNDMANVYSERSYARQKKPKILSRIYQLDSDVAFDTKLALEKNFDILCAVDTNTREITGKWVSVVGIVVLQQVWADAKGELAAFWQYYTPFCLEYVELQHKPENFGWIASLQHLEKYGQTDPMQRIGIIVDSDLGNLNDYNMRNKPVLETTYLPKNVVLIYAAGDAGKENVINKALSCADSASSQCLDALEQGVCPFNKKLSNNDSFESMRIIRSTAVKS